MGTKHIEIVEHTCDRCGGVETIKIDTGSIEKEQSKGLLVALTSDALFVEPAFKRIVVANEYPEAAQKVHLWLCPGCRGELATFLNAKQ